MRRKRKPLKKLPETVSKLVEAAQKPFKLFFHDEARFGRISQAIACWSPIGTRPMIPKQVIREYTYAYTAACPENGETVSLILPQMTTHCMNIFLEEKLKYFMDNPQLVQSIVGYHWILSALK